MDSEMIFNELSVVPLAQDIPTARQRMSNFINTLSSINISRVKKVLRTHQEFHATELASNYLLTQWRNDHEVDKEEQRFLRTLATKSPFLFDLPQAADKSRTFEFRWGGNRLTNPNNQICGLGAAYLLDSLAISFFSESQWDVSQLELQIEELNEDGNLERQFVSICHASRVAHIESHKNWINEWLQRQVEDGAELWERLAELFPHLSFCETVYKQLALLDCGSPSLRQVVKRLFELEHYSQNWLQGIPFEADGLPSKATPEGGSRRGQL